MPELVAPALQAAGNIYPSRFIVANTGSGNNREAIQATGESYYVLGVSDEGQKTQPNDGDSAGVHAADGDAIRYYQYGRDPLVELGGTVDSMTFVMPDANGKAITATSGAVACGILLEGGVASEKRPVLVIPSTLAP